jgi:predicted nucleic acid-binding protein
VTVFLDTNVLVYQLDHDEPEKRARATALVNDLPERPWVSTQVLLELHDVLVRRLAYSREEAQDTIEGNPFRVQPADAGLVYDAVATATRHQLRIYDAMILEAAVRAGCDEIWTEDLQTGATLRGVRIVNPFADPPS